MYTYVDLGTIFANTAIEIRAQAQAQEDRDQNLKTLEAQAAVVS